MGRKGPCGLSKGSIGECKRNCLRSFEKLALLERRGRKEARLPSFIQGAVQKRLRQGGETPETHGGKRALKALG